MGSNSSNSLEQCIKVSSEALVYTYSPSNLRNHGECTHPVLAFHKDNHGVVWAQGEDSETYLSQYLEVISLR